jgi:hypothetical protein
MNIADATPILPPNNRRGVIAECRQPNRNEQSEISPGNNSCARPLLGMCLPTFVSEMVPFRLHQVRRIELPRVIHGLRR